MSTIRVQGLTKTYRDGESTHEVLSGMDLQVEAGEFVALIGRSGSGKSTLLNCLAGIDTFDTGSVEIDGIELSGLDEARRTHLRRDRIGIVFQFFHLLPILDVRHNVALPALLRGDRRAEVNERVDALLRELDIAEKADASPDRLSGGQQQRVAIARALINDPAVLLADEPTGNLDTETAQRTLELFQRVHEQHGVTILMVTHADEATAVADRVAHLVEGSIVDAPPVSPAVSEADEAAASEEKPPPPDPPKGQGNVRQSARAAALFASQEEPEPVNEEEAARRAADRALADAETDDPEGESEKTDDDDPSSSPS